MRRRKEKRSLEIRNLCQQRKSLILIVMKLLTQKKKVLKQKSQDTPSTSWTNSHTKSQQFPKPPNSFLTVNLALQTASEVKDSILKLSPSLTIKSSNSLLHIESLTSTQENPTKTIASLNQVYPSAKQEPPQLRMITTQIDN